MTSEPILFYLVGIFVVLLITAKIGGTIGFWVCSSILGNKLAALVQEESDDGKSQETTQHHGAPPWKVTPRRQHQPRQPRST